MKKSILALTVLAASISSASAMAANPSLKFGGDVEESCKVSISNTASKLRFAGEPVLASDYAGVTVETNIRNGVGKVKLVNLSTTLEQGTASVVSKSGNVLNAEGLTVSNFGTLDLVAKSSLETTSELAGHYEVDAVIEVSCQAFGS